MIDFQTWRVSWSFLKPDVIVTTGTPGAVAAMKATKTIPFGQKIETVD